MLNRITTADARKRFSNIINRVAFGDEAFVLFEWMKTQPEMVAILKDDQFKIKAGAHHLRARYLLDSGANWKAFQSYIKAGINDVSIFAKEKNRIAFALLNSILPLNGLRQSFINNRTQKVNEHGYENILAFIKE